jgi:hypothetical protein
VGFYAGQLHYYHAMYGTLALALLGVLADTSGVNLVGGLVSPPCVLLFNSVNWIIALLLLSFSMLPLFFVTWERQGFLHACVKPIKQMLQLSPLFFILQGTSSGRTSDL